MKVLVVMDYEEHLKSAHPNRKPARASSHCTYGGIGVVINRDGTVSGPGEARVKDKPRRGG